MILVTGFQSYGGRSTNPAEAVAFALNGASVAGVPVKGHALPVDLASVTCKIVELIDSIEPRVVIALGLWPGEPMIRLERLAANWSWFELPDNAGRRQDGAVMEGEAAAYLSTLPHDAIQAAIRAAGVPCRQSGSAGTYLCNATSYVMLRHCAQRHRDTAAGFIHLPYLPEQVAQMLDDIAREGRLELHQRADMASMSLDAMVNAVTIAIETTLEELER